MGKFSEELKEILPAECAGSTKPKSETIKQITTLAKKTALECLPKKKKEVDEYMDNNGELVGELLDRNVGFNEAISQAETELKEVFK
jgi:hypothetical protein